MTSKETFDLIVIGSGPGGYVAAVRAAQLGMKTACIEKNERLGGVCLNVGCIPSKALLDSSEYYHLAKDRFAEHGIKTGRVSLDLGRMMARKEKVVKELTDNVRQLLEGHKITIIQGAAELAGPDQVTVTKGKKKQTLAAKHILLATGSAPVSVPGLDFDEKMIVSSTGALNFDAVPKHLGIVGGGYIGLEMAENLVHLKLQVKLVEIDSRSGKVRLSRKALLPRPEGMEDGPRDDRPRGGGGDRRGGRGGGLGDPRRLLGAQAQALGPRRRAGAGARPVHARGAALLPIRAGRLPRAPWRYWFRSRDRSHRRS